MDLRYNNSEKDSGRLDALPHKIHERRFFQNYLNTEMEKFIRTNSVPILKTCCDGG